MAYSYKNLYQYPEIKKGIRKWKNYKNNFCVLMLHYTADPKKDPGREGKEWYEKEKKGYATAMWEKEYEINFGTKSGKLIYGSDFCDFSPSVHFKQSFKLPEPIEHLISLDFGQRNPTCALIGAWTLDHKLYIIDEYYEPAIPSVSSRRMFEQFSYLLGDDILELEIDARRSKAQSFFQSMIIDPTTRYKNRVKVLGEGDEIPYSIIEEFYDNGWDFAPGVNSVGAGINRVREYFKVDKNGDSRLYIFYDKCPNLVYQLQNYRYKELTEIQAKNRNAPEEPVTKADHCCISGDSIIHTVNGDIKIKDLIGQSGYVYCYSQQKHRITVSKFTNVVKTGRKKTIKIITDIGDGVYITDDHPVMLRNGEYVPAGELKIGDSLMPFYRGIDTAGHLIVYLNDGHKMFAHRLVYNDIIKKLPEDSWTWNIHHIDLDKLNNSPDNLQLLSRSEHCKLHATNRHPTLSTKQKLRATMLKKFLSQEYKKKALQHLDEIRLLTKAWHGSKEGIMWHQEHAQKGWSQQNREKRKIKKQCIVCDKKFISQDGTGMYCCAYCRQKQRIILGKDQIGKKCIICKMVFSGNQYQSRQTCSDKCYRQWRSLIKQRNDKIKQKFYNHKIVDIQPGKKMNVYNMEVENVHNFACNGIILHNCDALKYLVMNRPNMPKLAEKPKNRIQRDIDSLLRPKIIGAEWDSD